MDAEIGVGARKGKGVARAALSQLTALLYPPRCIACPAETDAAGGLCPECWREIEFISGPVCRSCGTPVEAGGPRAQPTCDTCSAFPPDWDRGCAALIYGGAGRRVILQLKHGDRLDIAPTLARWMQRAGGDLLERADIVAPVPLHWSRLLKRRYNQSAELARHIAPAAQVQPRLLERHQMTPSLDGRRRDERASLLAEAIRLAPRAAPVAGKSVLLVDDVLTTGATLSACARVLKAADATEVNILTLARVVMDRRT